MCVCVCVDVPSHEILVVVRDHLGLADLLPEAHVPLLMSKGTSGVGLGAQIHLQLGGEPVEEVDERPREDIRVDVQHLGIHASRVKEHRLGVVGVRLKKREQQRNKVNFLVGRDHDAEVRKVQKLALSTRAVPAPRGGPRRLGGLLERGVSIVDDPTVSKRCVRIDING